MVPVKFSVNSEAFLPMRSAHFRTLACQSLKKLFAASWGLLNHRSATKKKNTNPKRKIIDLHLICKTYSANATTGEKDKTTNGTKIDDKLDRHLSLPFDR